jgi:hypothetical protein
MGRFAPIGDGRHLGRRIRHQLFHQGSDRALQLSAAIPPLSAEQSPTGYDESWRESSRPERLRGNCKNAVTVPTREARVGERQYEVAVEVQESRGGIARVDVSSLFT